MSKMVAYARSFDGFSTGATDANGNLILIKSCVSLPPATYQDIQITSFDQGQTIFSCSGSPLVIASNGASMISSSDISVTSCYFTCSQQNLSTPPTIGINFTMSKNTSSVFVENKIIIPFQTSVTPRNDSY
jgi:hypothetical protein